jgi:hypothetical protein
VKKLTTTDWHQVIQISIFYIVTFVYWNIVYIESCMCKSVLGIINKLQKKVIQKVHMAIGDMS